jgi:hypothetical protein
MDLKKLFVIGGVAVGAWWLLKRMESARPAPLTKSQAEAQDLYAKFQALVVGITADAKALDPDKVKSFEDQVARYKTDNLDAGAAALAAGDAQKAQYCFDALITSAPTNIAAVQQFVAGAPEALAALKRQGLQVTVRSV